MSGYQEPNYTQAPNAFFDKLLPEIDSITELKVTLAVIRQTFGYHRKEDALSLTRLSELTGLPRKSVVDGVNRALKRGSIIRRKVGQSYKYRLKVVTTGNQSGDQSSYQRLPEVVTTGNQQVVTTGNPQKKDRNKEKESTPVGAPEAPRIDLVKVLVEDLQAIDVYLSNEEKKKYAGQIGQLRRKDVQDKRIIRAIKRLVADWDTYPHTSLQKALSFAEGHTRQGDKRETMPSTSDSMTEDWLKQLEGRA